MCRFPSLRPCAEGSYAQVAYFAKSHERPRADLRANYIEGPVSASSVDLYRARFFWIHVHFLHIIEVHRQRSVARQSAIAARPDSELKTVRAVGAHFRQSFS